MLLHYVIIGIWEVSRDVLFFVLWHFFDLWKLLELNEFMLVSEKTTNFTSFLKAYKVFG